MSEKKYRYGFDGLDGKKHYGKWHSDKEYVNDLIDSYQLKFPHLFFWLDSDE